MKSLAPKRKPMATRVSPTPMDDVMGDLETLGRRAGCAVLSIGAVAFNPDGGLGKEFYIVINRKSQVELGLHEDDETLKWWASQTEEARQVLEDAGSLKKSVPLDVALVQFNKYIISLGGAKVKLWGNGSDFDNSILINLYAAAKMLIPWGAYNNRCYRTLKSIIGGPKLVCEGTHHNALDDARSQALHAIELFKLLRA